MRRLIVYAVTVLAFLSGTAVALRAL